MRKTIILAAAASLMLAGAANAQQQPTPQPSPTPTAPAPSAPKAQAPEIQSVSIVEFTDLPQATQTQVNQIIAERGDAGLQTLRGSIDATPKVKSALEAKGLTSAQVIAASMQPNGALTLITKKAS